MAACSSTAPTHAPLDTGLHSRPAVQDTYDEKRQIAMELGATYGGPGYPSGVLRRVDRSSGQIRWGFNNYGYFSDGAYNVVASREGCWMTYRATFLDLSTGVEFTGRVAQPHLMDPTNCKRISATWGPLRDGIQGLRAAIRRATPGPGANDVRYSGYGDRFRPEPYSGGTRARPYTW